MSSRKKSNFVQLLFLIGGVEFCCCVKAVLTLLRRELSLEEVLCRL